MVSPLSLQRRGPRGGVVLGLLLTGLAQGLAGPLLPLAPQWERALAAEPAVVAADPAVVAILERAQQSCRDGLARRFNVVAASVDVWLTPGLRIAIETGEAALGDLRRNGLEFGWMLPEKPAPAPIGLCRTSGDGRLQAIEQQPD